MAILDLFLRGLLRAGGFSGGTEGLRVPCQHREGSRQARKGPHPLGVVEASGRASQRRGDRSPILRLSRRKPGELRREGVMQAEGTALHRPQSTRGPEAVAEGEKLLGQETAF